jgi:uncharacterized protein YjgD (DUF1641 family)
MAEPIPFIGARRDIRGELMQRLEQAQEEHTEALLDAYDVLQKLRDSGILEILKGLLGSGDKVLQIWVETLEGKDVVRTVRNLTILLKIVGSLDPVMLENVMKSLGTLTEGARSHPPPSLFRIMCQFSSVGARRSLGLAAAAAESVGQNLIAAEIPPSTKPRHKTTRHRA